MYSYMPADPCPHPESEMVIIPQTTSQKVRMAKQHLVIENYWCRACGMQFETVEKRQYSFEPSKKTHKMEPNIQVKKLSY
jgi:predicted Zn-ribbon and HTH transcriptional regulator